MAGTMEFREYYRGVCVKIRFDSHTSTYIGELDGLPSRSMLEAGSYQSLQGAFKQVVDDHMAGKTPSLEEEHWAQASQLNEKKFSQEADELQQAINKIAAEMDDTSK